MNQLDMEDNGRLGNWDLVGPAILATRRIFKNPGRQIRWIDYEIGTDATILDLDT